MPAFGIGDYMEGLKHIFSSVNFMYEMIGFAIITLLQGLAFYFLGSVKLPMYAMQGTKSLLCGIFDTAKINYAVTMKMVTPGTLPS